MLDKQLLDILVCPKCKKAVSSTDAGKNLFCESCNMRYPVRDGIPIMSIEEAMDIHSERDMGGQPGICHVPTSRSSMGLIRI